jgi:uncharacterized membrane protein
MITLGPLAVSLVLVALAWLMPTLGRPTLQFGVRVPADHADDPVISTARGAYRRWIAVAGGAVEVAAAGVVIAFGSSFWATAVTVGTFGAVILVFATGYARARHRILAAKQGEGWYAGRRQGIAVDTSLRTEPEPVPWRWILPALLVLAGTLVVGIVRYPSMPAMLATHYRVGRAPDHLVAKSVGVAFTPVFIQIGVTALIVLLTLVVFRSKPDIDVAASAATARQHRIFLTRMAKGLFVLAASIDLSMAVVAWFIWTGDTTGFVGLVLAPALIGIGTVLAVAIRTGQEGNRVPVTTHEDPAPPLVQRDDDALWRGGLVYVNPDDPALFIPKRFGVGWAVNFGNRLVWILVVAIIGSVVVAVALLD